MLYVFVWGESDLYCTCLVLMICTSIGLFDWKIGFPYMSILPRNVTCSKAFACNNGNTVLSSYLPAALERQHSLVRWVIVAPRLEHWVINTSSQQFCWPIKAIPINCRRTRSKASLERRVNLPCILFGVTWLILPVVICLSQRLSHACLSMNRFILWNCRWLIKSVIISLMVSRYMDSRSNSRANTCVKSRLRFGWRRDVFIRFKANASFGWVLCWLIITVRIAWLYAGDSSFKFLPYQLSTVV